MEHSTETHIELNVAVEGYVPRCLTAEPLCLDAIIAEMNAEFH